MYIVFFQRPSGSYDKEEGFSPGEIIKKYYYDQNFTSEDFELVEKAGWKKAGWELWEKDGQTLNYEEADALEYKLSDEQYGSWEAARLALHGYSIKIQDTNAENED